MISNKFTTEFSVKRQVWTTEEVDEVIIDKSEEQIASSFYGYRQQASAEYMQKQGLTFSKPHIIWCGLDSEVTEGDILESAYGVDQVKAKQINADGANGHIELLVEFIGQELGS
jgi:hypothetical protein